MSIEDFQLIDNEPIGISILKRGLSKIHHQQGANSNDSDRIFEFIFGENNIYHQKGNSYLEFDITVSREDNANFTNIVPIKMTNNPFAFWFKEGRLFTMSGGDLEHNKYFGQISTIMKAITSKDGDLLSQLDNNNEGNGNADFDSTSLKKC